MSFSPLAFVDSLRIGAVDFVSPDEIKVLLDIEAPDTVALNTGVPREFPRIHAYLLIPSDEGHLVAQVEWITVERSQYPKRKGMQDFGLIDLPFPLRKMCLNPLGNLSQHEDEFEFRRGVGAYPAIGAPVLLPTQKQLRAIVESGQHRRVKIGTSPLAANAEVRIDPDRLFGRHLAVLGNTGSGKSCSVAGLIRWSMEAAKAELLKRNDNAQDAEPNARFIALDPNGEYANTFTDMSKVRVFAVEASDSAQQLQVPIWFWNTAEWSAFTQASARTQRPTLIQALRSVRDGVFAPEANVSHEMRRYLRIIVSSIQVERDSGRPFASFPGPKNFFQLLSSWASGLNESDSFLLAQKNSLSALRTKINELVSARAETPSNRHPNYLFGRDEVDELLRLGRTTHLNFGGADTDVLPIDADVPRQFTGSDFLRSVEANAELLNVSDHVETMLMRIRTILSDTRMKTMTGDSSISLDQWLRDYIGDTKASNGSVTVIDLSLVPTEVIHVITSVIARMTLEALQRYRKLNKGKTLPTVLVMEEAHTFIRRYSENPDEQNSAAICCHVFEKIAREGRKFGLGLVLSSQRPSELSPTVLSQCNSFLLHRISNDRDQELVHKLVPDNLRGLLRDLPSLPSQHAILMGWASELPIFVQMRSLPKAHRPESEDPTFWDVWTGKETREIDWKSVADDWQQVAPSDKPI